MIPPAATLTFDVELVNIERPGGLKASMFDKIDVNKDKKISREEMKKYIAEFGRLPGDNEAQHSKRTRNIFDREDRNKDGFISVDEFSGTKRDELWKYYCTFFSEKGRMPLINSPRLPRQLIVLWMMRQKTKVNKNVKVNKS